MTYHVSLISFNDKLNKENVLYNLNYPSVSHRIG